MRVLKTGDKGDDVRQMQQRLSELGFLTGSFDGQFGANTRSAVSAFQRNRGLLVDGIAGLATLRALDLISFDDFVVSVSVLPSVTVDKVAIMFPGAPRQNIEMYLPFVLKALENVELIDREMVLMALATIRAETGSFAPISELPSKLNTAPPGPDFNLYDRRTDLGNQGPPDGERYRGRGFIQLTGKDNYRRYGQKVGLGDDLVNNPDIANSTQIAAQLMAAFLKDKEYQIREALSQNRLDKARRAINGGLNGLAAFEKAYRAGAAVIK